MSEELTVVIVVLAILFCGFAMFGGMTNTHDEDKVVEVKGKKCPYCHKKGGVEYSDSLRYRTTTCILCGKLISRKRQSRVKYDNR